MGGSNAAGAVDADQEERGHKSGCVVDAPAERSKANPRGVHPPAARLPRAEAKKLPRLRSAPDLPCLVFLMRREALCA